MHRHFIELGTLTAVLGAVWVTAMIGMVISAEGPAGDYMRVQQGHGTVTWMAIALLVAMAMIICIVGLAYQSQLHTTRRLLGRHPPHERS